MSFTNRYQRRCRQYRERNRTERTYRDNYSLFSSQLVIFVVYNSAEGDSGACPTDLNTSMLTALSY